MLKRDNENSEILTLGFRGGSRAPLAWRGYVILYRTTLHLLSTFVTRRIHHYRSSSVIGVSRYNLVLCTCCRSISCGDCSIIMPARRSQKLGISVLLVSSYVFDWIALM